MASFLEEAKQILEFLSSEDPLALKIQGISMTKDFKDMDDVEKAYKAGCALTYVTVMVDDTFKGVRRTNSND
jgi:hypothetical protein